MLKWCLQVDLGPQLYLLKRRKKAMCCQKSRKGQQSNQQKSRSKAK